MTKAAPSPGRPRSFDEERALASAMHVFWVKGYNNTSYPDLEAATGLRRQSLVYAFGDKQAMFERTLTFYVTRRVGEIIAKLEAAKSPVAGIREVFDTWLNDAAHGSKRGCMLVNTAAEIGSKHPTVAKTVDLATRKLTRAFEQAFERAQEQGEISTHCRPADLACLAVAAGDGALLHARVTRNTKDVARAYRALLALIT